MDEAEIRKRAIAIEDFLATTRIPKRYRLAIDEWADIDQRHKEITEEVKAWINRSPTDVLLLYGPPGTGKTVLACLAILEFIDKYCAPAKYTTALEIVQELKSDWNKEVAIREKYGALSGLLVIDEIDLFKSDSEYMWLLINQLISRRYDRMVPTILISNLDIKELENTLGERAMDRVKENGKRILVDCQNYRKSREK